MAALAGCIGLLLTGVLDWNSVIGDKAAWNIFIWYGGLLRLGRALHEKGVTEAFAGAVGARFSLLDWLPLLLVALLIFYYSH